MNGYRPRCVPPSAGRELAGCLVEQFENAMAHGEPAAAQLEPAGGLALGDRGEATQIGQADLDRFLFQRAMGGCLRERGYEVQSWQKVAKRPKAVAAS